jgi:magnesium transporter
MRKRTDKRNLRQSSTTGMAPGTPIFIGEKKMLQSQIDIIEYSENSCAEQQGCSIDTALQLAQSKSITWIDINGIDDLAMIETLGANFKLHPLTIEDIVNTHQRPKIDEFAEYIFVALKKVVYSPTEDVIEIEQVSLILGDNYVISFQEKACSGFELIRERIRTAKGRIRTMKADYLVYALMDDVVDNYFSAVEHIGDIIEDIDERIIDNPLKNDIHKVHRLKRDLMGLRKAVWPLREEIGALQKNISPLISAETGLFLRDLYDHTIQIIDIIETLRDLIGSMHDTYLSSISNRMNEIMKVLTIISTVFIPLTFITGLYGMNFENMPELKWPWGYYFVWGVMAVIVVGLVSFFRRKKWL